MNQQQRLETVLETIQRHMSLQKVDIDADISDSNAFLKMVNVRCHNWSAEHLPKIGALQFSVKVPSLDALNMIIYPEQESDAPIFLLFFLLTRRKVICHFNVNTPFDDEQYLNKWVRPLDALLEKYPVFECMDRYPDWMKQYKHSCTVYGLFKQDRLPELSSCSIDYLNDYLGKVVSNKKTVDPDRLEKIAAFHQQFKQDIRTRDKAQAMTAKFIGKEKARRIMYEVVT